MAVIFKKISIQYYQKINFWKKRDFYIYININNVFDKIKYLRLKMILYYIINLLNLLFLTNIMKIT